MSQKTKFTIEGVKREIEEKLGSDYVVLSDTYVNNNTPLRIFHKVCGKEYNATRHNIMTNNSKCRYCYGALKISNEEFLKRVKESEGDKLTILGKYINADTAVLCRCNNCNYEWGAYPCNLYAGTSCPKCAMKAAGYKRRTTNEQFKKQVYNVHRNTIIPIEDYKSYLEKIAFKCNTCGGIFYKSPQEVIEKQRGCGICSLSKGEQKIYHYLKENNIDFVYEKSFPNLLGVGGRNLTYDFYLPNENILIEYQGNFHDGTAHIQKPESLIIQKEHDKRKCEYAKSHNIPLLEIWYQDYINTESILEDFLLKAG